MNIGLSDCAVLISISRFYIYYSFFYIHCFSVILYFVLSNRDTGDIEILILTQIFNRIELYWNYKFIRFYGY